GAAHRARGQLAADSAQASRVQEVADPLLADDEHAPTGKQHRAGGAQVRVVAAEAGGVARGPERGPAQAGAEADDRVAEVERAGGRAVASGDEQVALPVDRGTRRGPDR